MKNLTIIIIMTALLHLSLSAQIVTPTPPTIASTQHISDFPGDSNFCDLVRFYKDSTIVSCFYSMYENTAAFTPTSEFAIIEYGRRPTSTHWYFSLPARYRVMDMEILDTMCYFCGFYNIGVGFDSTAFVGRFSVEELIRHGNTCSYDILLLSELNSFTKIAVSHVRGDKELFSLAVIGTEGPVYSFDPNLPPTYPSVLVVLGNSDLYLNSFGWHYNVARPLNVYTLHFKDVLSGFWSIHVSTTYNDRIDSIGVITVQDLDYNINNYDNGAMNVLTLPIGNMFHISHPIIMCHDPVNNNVQLFATMSDKEEGYGLYANNFTPQSVVYNYNYINTRGKLYSPLESVGLPWQESVFVTAKEEGTDIHRIYRLLQNFVDNTYYTSLYCPKTTNRSIDRFNNSTFITGGTKIDDNSIFRHSIMSQNEVFFNDSTRSCYSLDSTFYIHYEHPENCIIKETLHNSVLSSFHWQQYQATVYSNETTNECLKTGFHFFD